MHYRNQSGIDRFLSTFCLILILVSDWVCAWIILIHSFGGMAKLVVSTFIGNGSMRLYLDDKAILVNSDAVTVELNGDKEYVIHWFVQGAADTSYSITISSPKEAEFQLTRSIGKEGKDWGGIRF